MVSFAYHSHDGFIDGGRVGADVCNFQTHRSQELSPLPARALDRCESRHHRQIDLGGLPVHLRVREDHFVEQNDGIGAHGLDDVFKNLAAFVVWPVVENGSKVVESSAYTLIRGS